MLNRVILMGRLTADPENKQTPNGVSVTSFSLAVERNYANSDGKRKADFINIVAWRNTADFICNYFSKGRLIALEGCIQTRNYEDKNGNKRTAFEVIADHVYFAESKSKDENKQDNKPSSSNNVQPKGNTSNPSTDFSISSDFEEIDTDNSDLPF